MLAHEAGIGTKALKKQKRFSPLLILEWGMLTLWLWSSKRIANESMGN